MCASDGREARDVSERWAEAWDVSEGWVSHIPVPPDKAVLVRRAGTSCGR